MKPAASVLSRLFASALPLVLPSACAGCGVSGARVICAGCAACLDDSGEARCARCALPLAGPDGSPAPANLADTGVRWDSAGVDAVATFEPTPPPLADGANTASPARLCGQCIAAQPAFDAAWCVAGYAAPADAYVIALKFHRRLALATSLASALAERVQAAGVALPDVVVPVPLSSRRLATRGYNQAWEIARPLARRLRVPAAARLLIRSRDTRAQAELSGDERRRNMRRAFEVPCATAVRGRHIGLVDDVMTSGATLDAAARALKQAGASRVTALVILRTPTP
jgi:ComF family protein